MPLDFSNASSNGQIAELFKKADAAAGFNANDALRFLDEILRIQPENYRASFEKGAVLASIRGKDADSIYLDASVEWLEKAWKLAPESEKDAVMSEARRVISQNSIELEKYLSGPMEKSRFGHIDYDRFLDWNTYVEAILRVAYALKKMSDLDAGSKQFPDRVIACVMPLFKGYSDPHGSYRINEDHEKQARKLLTDASAKIQAIDPSFTAPNPVAKKRGVCFVATAAMGDPDHPDVILLRELRDRWLTRQFWGNTFIRWYYRDGPKLAAIINRSQALRTLARLLVVRPGAWLAHKILRKP